MPASPLPLSRQALASRRLSVLNEDAPLPVALINQRIMEGNSAWMREFLEGSDASLCPHGKTSMSPQLFAHQLNDGCWGITLATCHQVQVARAYGINRIILANQLVGRQELSYISEELARDVAFDFYCFVDSVEGVRRLDRASLEARLDRPIQVILEGGFAGGRCGCRTLDEASRVLDAIGLTNDRVRVVGTGGFEGLYQYRWNDDRVALVSSFLSFLVEIAELADAKQLFASGDRIILTAGGSADYDLVAETFRTASLSKPVKVITRSGCYLTHDSSIYDKLQDELKGRSIKAQRMPHHLEGSLEVWAYVLSTPEPDVVILSAGRRDFGQDLEIPSR